MLGDEGQKEAAFSHVQIQLAFRDVPVHLEVLQNYKHSRKMAKDGYTSWYHLLSYVHTSIIHAGHLSSAAVRGAAVGGAAAAGGEVAAAADH